jgi:hypothetical protein
MRFGLLASAIYLLQATNAARSSIQNAFVTEVTDANGQMQTANCQCDCECVPIVENPCQLDLYIMLDAAICVKDIWEEMKFRVDNLLLKIDDRHVIGNSNSVRISISKYADSTSEIISLGEEMSYSQLSSKLSEMTYLNEGSYLNNGIEGISQTIQRSMGSLNRNRAVLFITNGKSHKNVTNRSVMPALQRLRDLVQGRLYFNTLVDIAEYLDCDACDFNRVLLNPFGLDRSYENSFDSITPGLLVKSDDTLNVDSVKENEYAGAIISKLDLAKYFVPEVDFICNIDALNRASSAVKEKQDCTQCTCQCEAMAGPQGIDGIEGEQGPEGCQGCDGEPGKPGEDGRCGMDGPDGIPGIPGRPGSPGAHGHPGVEGPKGPNGEDGQPGVDGAHGNSGGAGQPGKKGGLGRPGTPGPDGNPGDIGGAGSPGALGPAGHPGKQGNQGQPGSRGNNGKPGQPGPKGAPGINGARGQTGSPGPNGNPGQDGSHGQKGFEGRQGRQGPAGENGSDGPAGAIGITGNPGKVGRDGKLGRAPSDHEIRAKIRAYLEQILPANGDNMVKNSPYECANFRSSLYMEILARFAGSSASSSSSYGSSYSSSSGSSSSSYSSSSGSSSSSRYSSGSDASSSSSSSSSRYSSSSDNEIDNNEISSNGYSSSRSSNSNQGADQFSEQEWATHFAEMESLGEGYYSGQYFVEVNQYNEDIVKYDVRTGKVMWSSDNNASSSYGSSSSSSSYSSGSSSSSSYSGSSSSSGYNSNSGYNWNYDYATGDEIDAAEADLDAENSSHEYVDEYNQYYEENDKELY